MDQQQKGPHQNGLSKSSLAKKTCFRCLALGPKF